MMLSLVFFASVREQLGVGQVDREWDASLSTVTLLLASLVKEEGDVWEQVLMRPNLLVAINQEMASLEASIKDGDEIAFFPPVTGG
ncbi:molybdopterin converting factor subunit 1 [Neptunomonas japonica]|uniref:molybdopterin converting factor subunit 1 n=1 Tax=Neptunomonas japonica TaxID=417574 RepID=UPI001B7FD520|nr:molybdopterin converting factor subunit 1 [Neptunomonas japonica]